MTDNNFGNFSQKLGDDTDYPETESVLTVHVINRTTSKMNEIKNVIDRILDLQATPVQGDYEMIKFRVTEIEFQIERRCSGKEAPIDGGKTE